MIKKPERTINMKVVDFGAKIQILKLDVKTEKK